MTSAPELFRATMAQSLRAIATMPASPFPPDLDRLAMLVVESGRDWRFPSQAGAKR